MGSATSKSTDGFVSRGAEVPSIDPNKLVIIGLDEEATPANWYAHCSRLEDETDESLAAYAEEVRRRLPVPSIDDPVDVYRDGKRLIVLDGRRSTRVARTIWAEQAKAGVPKEKRIFVRALVRPSVDPEVLFRFNFDSHKSKPLTQMQEARLYLNYHLATGEDVNKTLAFFGVTRKVVEYKLKVFDLAPELQNAIDGGFPVRAAVELADQPREEQKKILAKLREADSLKGVRATNGIRAAKRGEEVVRDTTRMRSRSLLEKWHDAVKAKKKDVRVNLEDVLKFVLGGNVPRDASDDFKGTLIEAGFKSK